MKKIRLDLDQLSVESFATERNGDAEQGTVRAHSGVPFTLDNNGGGCVVNQTMGTGEIYCVCENIDQPVTQGSDCVG